MNVLFTILITRTQYSHVVLAHTVYCTATGSSYARSSRSSASANFGRPSRINLAFSTSFISPVSLAMHGTSTPPWISGDRRRLPVISHPPAAFRRASRASLWPLSRHKWAREWPRYTSVTGSYNGESGDTGLLLHSFPRGLGLSNYHGYLTE